jgi:hypothetical protein
MKRAEISARPQPPVPGALYARRDRIAPYPPKALQKETRELLEKLDPGLRETILRKRKARAEVRVGLEGISLRIIGLRPAPAGGATR